MVYALIFVITFGSLFDIATQREHWPFSPYRMFSWVRENYSMSKTDLLGIAEGHPPREISLLEPRYIQPLSVLDLRMTLRKKPRDVGADEYYKQVLRHVFDRYEVLRIQGAHEGPKLKGIRLYEYYWELDSEARNAARPDRRELILEIMYPIEK